MVTGTWLNKDGLYIKYGTSLAVAGTAGEFKTYGPLRELEVKIDLSLLNTSTPTIIDYNTFFPSGDNYMIEQVDVVADVLMSTASSPTLSVGLIGFDQTTIQSNGNTAFVKAAAAATLAAGDKLVLTKGVTAAGDFVGNYLQTTTGGYVTAILGTATATGLIRVRIKYRGAGTIPY
jgi:hypothetical protein